MTKKTFCVAFHEKITKKIALELLEETWNDYIKKYNLIHTERLLIEDFLAVYIERLVDKEIKEYKDVVK